MSKEIIALIPARGGSKGFPRKNIAMLSGKPLISYSIQSAQKANLVSRVIVSTEDAEIAEVSRRYDSEVMDRPVELAQDDTPTMSVIIWVLNQLETEGYFADAIVLLQPTTPLRTSQDIDAAIQLYTESDCQSVVSICRMEHSPYWSFKVENGFMKPLLGKKYLSMRRQSLPKIYLPNGALFISSPKVLYRIKSFYTPRTVPYIMPSERSIDIDSEKDLWLAETILQNSSSTQVSED
jgi:CMP-N-acetylneuraminic acid synthetase